MANPRKKRPRRKRKPAGQSRRSPLDFKAAVAALEKREIERALKATGGELSAAAEMLNMSRSTFYRRLIPLKIKRPRVMDARARPRQWIDESVAELEAQLIRKALRQTGGDVVAASGLLRIERCQVYRKMKTLGIKQGFGR